MAGLGDRERLTQVIQQWNVDHYDLFELSAPNQDLEFHGVVRFYFQGGNGANVITKCIRVSSTATTSDVIDTLIEKFRPDMRMLTQNKYALYEVHVNGEERRLGDQEKVLWVQLNWGKDVREGRFLLKNENEKTVRDPALGFKEPAKEDNPNFRRKLSKREKKEKKKRDEEKAKQNQSVSSQLYTDAPETSFTRSISNPEAVMRRRRQQKLEKKLAQMQNREGGADSGGTLKIYGESLQPDVPYKTLLLSTGDTTATVVKEAMEKYGLEKEDPQQYCLVEVLLPPGSQEYHGGSVGDERVLDDGECPLAISLQHPKHRGTIIFQLRHRSADYKRRSKRQRAVSHDDLRKAHDQPATQADKLPYLVDQNSRDRPGDKHLLPLNVTEVVRDHPKTPGNQFLQLSAPDIRSQHCILAHTDGIVTVTPMARDAEIFVDKRRVTDTTMLRHGMNVQFGRHHFFKFVDPRFEEVSKQSPPPKVPPHNQVRQETNFDVDGHVETVTQRPGTQPYTQDRDGRVTPGLHRQASQSDHLPASLDFRLEVEEHLLKAVIPEVNSRSVQFKLAPTYFLYMAVRRLLLLPSQSSIPRAQHYQVVADFIGKMSKLIQRTIQEQHNDPTSLAFWMANTSEVLNLVKQDMQVQPFTMDGQELLAEAVQMAFHHLVRCFQGDLQRVMPAFLDPSEAFDDENPPQDQYNHGQPMLADVLNTLSAAMTLLRRCRVNAALTIQLFSQLFHFINMWLFNILVMEPQLQLCTRVWGLRLKRRLGSVEVWAEKQGLELAADCHLCRIIQAAHLLQAPKLTSDDVNGITSTCFKLNSMQLRALLTRYIPEVSEPPISPAFIERVVAIGEDMTDELIRTEGGEIRLEEDPDLHLPFLLPEDGYSCDTLRGIPDGLPEFVAPLSNSGLCHMSANNMSSGSWTVHMAGQQMPSEKLSSPQANQPEIIVVSFKKLMGSMGLSIVAAVGEGVGERGIYIKSVVPGGAAAQDGRLKAGDQLLEVDGRSLVGLSQEKAAELMTQTGSVVTLKVAKEGAVYHGLATLLDDHSPTMQRQAPNMPVPGPGEEPPPPYSELRHNLPNESGRSWPVPQPRAPNQGPRGDLDGRPPSADNLSSRLQQHPHVQLPPPSNFQQRYVDPRSKSTSNLHVDVSFNQPVSPGGMRGGPHGSVGPYSPYHRQGSNVFFSNYENQKSLESGHYSVKDHHHPPGLGFNSQPQRPVRRPSDRSSVSSRSSSTSGRDPRPQSAYYDAHPPPQQEQPSNYGGRPRSVEVTANKVKEWQEKYTPQSMSVPSGQHSARQDQGHVSSDPRSRLTKQGSVGYRMEEGGGHRTDGYRTDMNPAVPKGGANTRGPPPHGRPGQPPRGNAPANANYSNANYSNFRSAVQNRPQEQPRLSARERLFGKQGGPPPVGGTVGVSRAGPQGEQGPASSQENAQPASTQHRDMPIKPEPKPKPAVKPKPPVAKKPGPNVLPAEESGTGQQNPRGMHPEASRQQPGFSGQGSYSHSMGHPNTMDDFPPPPEEDMLALPPPPPMEEFYDPQHDEQDRMMEPIPPPPNLPMAFDEFGQPVSSGYDPNYQNMNFGPPGHASRMGPGPGSSQHNAPPWHPSSQPMQHSTAREREIADLQSRSYLSLQDQERLRKLLQEQDFHQRMRDTEEKSEYDADDDEVESYGRTRQHEMYAGRRNESMGPPRDSGRQNSGYQPLHGPPQYQPTSDRLSEEQHRFENLGIGSRPQYGSSRQESGDPRGAGDVRNSGGRNNPLGSAFEQNRDTEHSYEYMNFPPPNQAGMQGPPRSFSSDLLSVNAQDQGYHSLPHRMPHSEGQSPEDFASFQASKKSVSFNTDLNTYQIRTPSHSYSSEHMSPPAEISPSPGSNEVFQMPPSDTYYQSPPASSYVHQGGTPNVIGAQEVYRDPRSRIEAQKASEQDGGKSEMTDNMSFRDKMKYFRQEEGESVPQFKAQPSGAPWNNDYQSNGR